MAKTSKRSQWVAVAYLGLGLATLAGSGCLVVAAGAAGGAALGYVYYKGEVFHEYSAGFADTVAATRAALADLRMPVVKEDLHDGSGSIESRNNHNERVHIRFGTTVSKIPAQGTLTWVGVRAGVFGDDAVSETVLGQIGTRLATPAPNPPPPPPPSPLPLGPIQPVAAQLPQTPPPPLAREPIPVR